jgi:hypothetical protein
MGNNIDLSKNLCDTCSHEVNICCPGVKTFDHTFLTAVEIDRRLYGRKDANNIVICGKFEKKQLKEKVKTGRVGGYRQNVKI